MSWKTFNFPIVFRAYWAAENGRRTCHTIISRQIREPASIQMIEGQSLFIFPKYFLDQVLKIGTDSGWECSDQFSGDRKEPREWFGVEPIPYTHARATNGFKQYLVWASGTLRRVERVWARLSGAQSWSNMRRPHSVCGEQSGLHVLALSFSNSLAAFLAARLN